MHETAAERERRLRQIRGGSELLFYLQDYTLSQWVIQYPEMTNPCAEITIVHSNQLCALGTNPLIKFTKYKFNF